MSSPDFDPTVPGLIARSRARFGDRPLILLGERRITYAEADEASLDLARGLLARGVGKGTRVGLLMGNGPDWVIGWLAATRIGALAVPINTFFKPRELGWVLRHADVHTLLTSATLLGNDYQSYLEKAAPSLQEQKGDRLVCPELPHLRQVFVYGGSPRPWALEAHSLVRQGTVEPRLDRDFVARIEAEVTPADPMIVIYSSGSMAEPKGVIHSHAAVLRQAWNLDTYRDTGVGDVVWTPMPFFWVGGLVIGLVQSMLTGCFVLCEEVFEPGATLELLERERANHVIGWPQYATALIDHPDFERRDLSSVRSGTLYPLLPEELRPEDPELRPNSLGMTETCGPHTYDRMDVPLPESLRGSFGRAMPGVEHKVVDPETGETLPTGAFGEICVRGGSLMLGLYKRERQEVFDADGYYHTGDAGHFDEQGHLFFRSRLAEMIKTGGANVTPREVEVVLDAQPEVQGAYVVGVPHPDRGQNVAAAIILNEGYEISSEDLRGRLKQEIAAYKVPRHIFFYGRDALPFTESGKMQKKKLCEMLAARVAEESET